MISSLKAEPALSASGGSSWEWTTLSASRGSFAVKATLSASGGSSWLETALSSSRGELCSDHFPCRSQLPPSKNILGHPHIDKVSTLALGDCRTDQYHEDMATGWSLGALSTCIPNPQAETD